MNPESSYLQPSKCKSSKLKPFPFIKGERLGKYFTVLEEDYSYYHKRYQIKLQCDCGDIIYRRLNHIRINKNMDCYKCRGFNNYPEKRKSSANFENELHKVWLSITNQNLQRGSRILESTITMQDLRNQYDKQNGKCIYTGIDLELLYKTKDESNASIDRRDSKEGYTINNIQWVYKPLNIMKNSFSEEEFLFVCNKVTDFTRKL